MNCVILYRIKGGPVMAIIHTNENIFEFPNGDAALAYVENNALFSSGQADYQIVELNEL